MSSRGATGVHSITSAADPHTQDMTHRMKVYGLQQGFRLVCIIGAVVVDVLWIRIVLLVAAAVLPWLGVMLANQGADRSERTSLYYRPPQRAELPTSAQTRATEPTPESVVVDAEFRVHHPPRALPPTRMGTSRN